LEDQGIDGSMIINYTKFEVSTAMRIQVVSFCVVTLCNVVLS